jgi:SNF2 family DNA or RNA helicase
MILDEAQMVKNASTKTSSALRNLSIPHRFALSVFIASQNKRLNHLSNFWNSHLTETSDRWEESWHDRLETEEQKTVYLAYLKRMKQEVDQMDSATFRKQRVSILAGLTRLRQICDDPRLVIPSSANSSSMIESILVNCENNKTRRPFSFAT